VRAWVSCGVASLLFVVPACGTVSRQPVPSTSAPPVSAGRTTDSGERWLGAEPVGGLVVETAPKVGAMGSAGSPRAPSRVVAPPPPAPPVLQPTASPPPPPRITAPPIPPPPRPPACPQPPPPPVWRTPPLPPPPGSAANWHPGAREPMPPPAIERAGDPRATASMPTAVPARMPPQPVEMVPYGPVGTRDPSAPASDSASLEGPPSGILPPPVVRRR